MKSNFTSDFFAGNRLALRRLANTDAPIIITGNGLLQRGADSTYAFAQDASFWYLTGIDEPDITLVMDSDAEYLIVPERDANRQAFDGSLANDQLLQRSGVKLVVQASEAWEQLTDKLIATGRVATIAAPPAYIEQYGMYTNPARYALIERLKRSNNQIDLIDVSAHLSRLRMIKQPAELRALQQAIDVTVASIKAATSVAKMSKYTHEYELEAGITSGFRKRGAAGHAFEPIVAGGGRACILHNVANNGTLQKNELLLLDVGAEVEHYAADISRTFSLQPPTVRQRAVHTAVLDVQSYAMNSLKSGVFLREYEQAIEQYMGKKLIDLGLIKTADHKAIRYYYPHATSHFLGLNVHDTGIYDEPLQAGSVITVEPGIYIPEEGIGIRIEDDVLITKKGVKVLTNKLSRELQ